MLCGLSVSPASTLSFVDWGASSLAAPVVSASVGAARAIPPVRERAIAIGSESLSFENIWISFVLPENVPAVRVASFFASFFLDRWMSPHPRGRAGSDRRWPGGDERRELTVVPARLGRNG